MALPVIADVMRVSVEGTLPNGHIWANVMHFRKTSILTFTGAIAIADPLIFALWNSALGGGTAVKAYMQTGWTMQRIRYTPLDGSSATTNISHALNGTAVPEILPANVAAVFTWYTALRGRANRGRTYLVGFAEDSNTAGGIILPAVVTALNTQLAGWLASFGASGVTPVVASYLNLNAHDVASFLLNNRWDTQRRRLGP